MNSLAGVLDPIPAFDANELEKLLHDLPVSDLVEVQGLAMSKL